MVSIQTRQAYSEIDEFLGLLSEEEKNMIPKKLREFFKQEKDKQYIKGIDPNIPIKEQSLKEETLAIIALLNLQYWCKDEKEKERLKQIYRDNDIKYQEELREKYNPDQIFKKSKLEKTKEKDEKVEMIIYKESIIIKIINKIKRFFHMK